MAEIPTPPRASQRLSKTYAVLLVVLVAAGVYTAYWQLTANAIRAQFLAWAAAERAAGAYVKFATPKTHSFPFKIDLELGDVQYERKDEVTIAIPNLHVRVRPWAPFEPLITGDTKSVFHLRDRNQVYKLERFKLRFRRPWKKPEQPSDPALFIHVRMKSLELDPNIQSGLSDLVQRISFDAVIKDHIPDFTNLQSMEKWRVAGGSIDLSDIHVVWSPLTLDCDGTLTLDKDLGPQASFSAKLSGHMEAVEMMLAKGEIRQLAASLFRAALTLLEDQDTPAGATKRISVPITVQDSMVSVAGIKVMRWGAAALALTPNDTQALSPADLNDDSSDDIEIDWAEETKSDPLPTVKPQ